MSDELLSKVNFHKVIKAITSVKKTKVTKKLTPNETNSSRINVRCFK